jgi:hypothetical protein
MSLSYLHHYEFHRTAHLDVGSFVKMAEAYTRGLELSALHQRIKENSMPGAREMYPGSRNHELQLLTLGSYRVAGRHTYEVAPELAQMFLHTSLKDIPSTLVKLPYQSIYIAVTGALDEPVQLWGGDSGWHDLAGLYVCAIDGGFFVWAWGAPNERSRNALDDAGLWFVIKPDVEDLESWLVDTYAPERVQDKVTAAPGVWSKLARLLVNTCLYLSSNDAEIVERLTPAHERLSKELTKWPKKSPKHKEAKDALRRQPRFRVVFPSLKEVLKVEQAGPRLHWVRGHWRLARVGPGRAVQELRWVRPHLRGGRDVPSSSTVSI